MALLLLVMVSAGNARLSWFLSGDHLRHIGLTTRTLEAGALEYSTQAYPHGWHAVMATMWAATGSRRDGAGLQLLVTLQATATWVVLVLIPLALGLTAATLSRATGLGPRMAGASGLVAGSLVLGPHFYGDYVTRGFDTTLLVLLALIAAVHRSTVAPTSSSALVTAVAAVVVTAHSWQVLLVPACVVSGIVVWRRQSWTRDRRVVRSEVLLLAAGAARLGPGVAGGLRWLRGGCGCRGRRRATARSWVVHRGCRIRGRPGPPDEARSSCSRRLPRSPARSSPPCCSLAWPESDCLPTTRARRSGCRRHWDFRWSLRPVAGCGHGPTGQFRFAGPRSWWSALWEEWPCWGPLPLRSWASSGQRGVQPTPRG